MPIAATVDNKVSCVELSCALHQQNKLRVVIILDRYSVYMVVFHHRTTMEDSSNPSTTFLYLSRIRKRKASLRGRSCGATRSSTIRIPALSNTDCHVTNFICSQEFCDEDMDDELKGNEGFAFNRRRGTANFFSADALLDFLKRNNLSHVVLAHEVQQVGFQVSMFV